LKLIDLHESIDSQPYAWSEKIPDVFKFETANGTKYIVIFNLYNKYQRTSALQYILNKIQVKVEGLKEAVELNNKHQASIYEIVYKIEGNELDQLSGEHDSLKVLSTIVDICKNRLKKLKVGEMAFFEGVPKGGEKDTGNTSRSRVYRVLVNRMKNEFPDIQVMHDPNNMSIFSKIDT